MDYDFGKVFNRFDVNTKDGKLDAKEAEAAMKAGYFAAKDMDKSIFEILNRSNSRSRETYKKDAVNEFLDRAEKTTEAKIDSIKNEITKRQQQ